MNVRFFTACLTTRMAVVFAASIAIAAIAAFQCHLGRHESGLDGKAREASGTISATLGDRKTYGLYECEYVDPVNKGSTWHSVGKHLIYQSEKSDEQVRASCNNCGECDEVALRWTRHHFPEFSDLSVVATGIVGDDNRYYRGCQRVVVLRRVEGCVAGVLNLICSSDGVEYAEMEASRYLPVTESIYSVSDPHEILHGLTGSIEKPELVMSESLEYGHLAGKGYGVFGPFWECVVVSKSGEKKKVRFEAINEPRVLVAAKKRVWNSLGVSPEAPP